ILLGVSGGIASYKSAYRAREHHVDLGPRLREQPREIRGLVAGDSAGDAEEDSPLVEGAHALVAADGDRALSSTYSARRRGTTRYSMSPTASSSRERVVSFFS